MLKDEAMDRKETTKWLGELLIKRIAHRGSYYATEVTLNYATPDCKRVDYIQFEPEKVVGGISGIEKGIFTCYEIKSCKADYKSGYGVNFEGEKNYIVTTMPTYKDIIKDEMLGAEDFGFMVAVPYGETVEDEFDNPHEPGGKVSLWDLKVIIPCRQKLRSRSMTELLFCMLRAGH